ncbi:response regulator [Emcibacter nanhaiensis]|uniref:Response regulator transcription factor n=1 Tax=Emcibacter nanhaiensis TaxID=1505037 RepID=A0A501PGF7_9PROT|nr:response regulator transcription factor [Emcibacter nanhaiensis]TPD59158.1 response regulator transcription factor [Emcibacter nanhaiensis]
MDDKRTIIIADDHPLFRTALQQAIGQAFGDCHIHEAGTLDDLQQKLEEVPHADFLLLDLQMPGTFGYSGLIFIREQFPELPIIIVSGNEAPATIHQCLNYGAAGFIAKSQSLPEMAEALQAVDQGQPWIPEAARSSRPAPDPDKQDVARILGSLTPQQYRVLSYMAQGLLNKQIAYEMDLSISTVKAHMTSILKKFGMFRRTQIVAAMKQLDLEELDQPQNSV